MISKRLRKTNFKIKKFSKFETQIKKLNLLINNLSFDYFPRSSYLKVSWPNTVFEID